MATDFILHVMFKPACDCCCRNRHCEIGAAEAARGTDIEVQAGLSVFPEEDVQSDVDDESVKD